MSNNADKIIESYKAGLINKYMAKKLMDIVSSGGVNDELCQELVDDACDASHVGVHSDDEYTAYFFVGNFADDILEDTFGMSVPSNQKKELCKYMFDHRSDGDYALDNLTDYRILTHKWLCDRLDKKAHPNIEGIYERQPEYDVDKWITTLKDVYAALHSKKNANRDGVIAKLTLEWDDDERKRFSNWMKYYEEGTPEKYNVKNAAFTKQAHGHEPSGLPEAWLNLKERQGDEGPQMSTYKPDESQTKRELELGNAKGLKIQMRSRLRSLKRLLDKYCDILSHQDMDSIQDEMFALDKSVNRLNVYASIEDCVIRTANKIERLGFPEGAALLKTAVEAPPPAPVNSVLPESMSAEPNLTPGSQASTSVGDVIGRLEGVSKRLKSRDTIRELATIDILLNDIGLASYFPELTDAQAKLIESYGYASNKIEAIIAKLRGSGTDKPTQQGTPKPNPHNNTNRAPNPTPNRNPNPMPQPNIQPPQAPKAQNLDTGELLTKPVGEVKDTLPPTPKG